MTISPDQRWLVLMVKEPRPGRVKTRLGRDIGMTEAAWWYRHQVARTLRRVADPRWRVCLAVSPDRDGLESRVWPRNLPRLPQGTGDLGSRMRRVFEAMPPGPVLIAGSDVPGLDRNRVAEGFAALKGADAVVGPAPDGGYWLIGFRRSRPLPGRLFVGVRWSTEHALADTLATMGQARVKRVAMLRDVDRASDLQRGMGVAAAS